MRIKKLTAVTGIFYGFLQMFLLAGCDNGPGPDTMLRFASGSNYTTNNQNVSNGQLISTSLYGQSGTANLSRFTIRYTYDNKDTLTYLDSTLNAKEFGMVFNFTARGLEGEETWLYTLYDSENKKYIRQYTLKTPGTKQPFYSHASVYLKRSALENLRYFNPIEGTSYPAYFIRNSNNIAFKDKIAFYIDGSMDNAMKVNIVGFNDSKLKVTSLVNLGEIGSVEAIKNAYNNATAEVNTVNNISVKKNPVIAFRTKANKYGVIGNFTFDSLTSNEGGVTKSILRQVKYEVRVEK